MNSIGYIFPFFLLLYQTVIDTKNQQDLLISMQLFHMWLLWWTSIFFQVRTGIRLQYHWLPPAACTTSRQSSTSPSVVIQTTGSLNLEFQNILWLKTILWLENIPIAQLFVSLLAFFLLYYTLVLLWFYVHWSVCNYRLGKTTRLTALNIKNYLGNSPDAMCMSDNRKHMFLGKFMKIWRHFP